MGKNRKELRKEMRSKREEEQANKVFKGIAIGLVVLAIVGIALASFV